MLLVMWKTEWTRSDSCNLSDQKTFFYFTIILPISVCFNRNGACYLLITSNDLGGQSWNLKSNQYILCIPQNSSIAGTSPSDCFMSYPGHSLEGGVLPLCRGAVGVFYSPIRLGKTLAEIPCNSCRVGKRQISVS